MRRGWMAGSHDANIYIRAAAVLSPDVYPQPRISWVPVAVVPARGFDGHIAGSIMQCMYLGSTDLPVPGPQNLQLSLLCPYHCQSLSIIALLEGRQLLQRCVDRLIRLHSYQVSGETHLSSVV